MVRRPASTSATASGAARSADATAPRWRSNPATAARTSGAATYTGASRASSASCNARSFGGVTSTDRVRYGEASSRRMTVVPSAMKRPWLPAEGASARRRRSASGKPM